MASRLQINVGNRSGRAALRGLTRPATYRTIATMARLLPDFFDALPRYLRATGEYPWTCRIRTPAGIVAPTLYSSHDVSTVVEIFCRDDYAADADVGAVVDIGANIGLSGLYFLTRSPGARVYMFEPDPRNAERLEQNLAGYEGRFELQRVAVGLTDGRVSFGTEPTGRYGRISDSYGDVIEVECRSIASLLSEVLDTEGSIDVLKVDVEGLEEELMRAIPVELLTLVRAAYFEADEQVVLHPELFENTFSNQTNRLLRR